MASEVAPTSPLLPLVATSSGVDTPTSVAAPAPLPRPRGGSASPPSSPVAILTVETVVASVRAPAEGPPVMAGGTVRDVTEASEVPIDPTFAFAFPIVLLLPEIGC